MKLTQAVLAVIVLSQISLLLLLYKNSNFKTVFEFSQDFNNRQEIKEENPKNYLDCQGKKEFSTDSVTNDQFQHIADSLYAYSAYYDNISETKPTIRLIVMDDPKKQWNPFLECYFFKGDLKLNKATFGSKILSPDSYNLNSASSVAFISCELPSDIGNPEFVSVYPMKLENVTKLSANKLRIYYPPNDSNYNYQVASCIQPLHSEVERPLFLLEWLEYYKMLGVQHFTFYNYSIGPKTAEILKSYGDQEVSVLNWSLPIVNGVRVWGQFVAASDCAYRHRGLAKYVITFDIDEFLIPRGRGNGEEVYSTFGQFFDHIWNPQENELKTNISSIKFESKVSFHNSTLQNTSTFYSQPNDEEIIKNLQLLNKVDVYPSMQRKFVFRPELVIESGVHWAQVEVNGTLSINHNINDDEGYYLHFRNCDPYYHQPNQVLKNNATCLSTIGMEKDEFAADNFGRKLAERVIEKMRTIIDRGLLRQEDFVSKFK